MNNIYGIPYISREVLEMQRIENGVINATLYILWNSPSGLLRPGDFMRSILRQAHECFAGTDQDGGFYVRHDKGHFFLYPKEFCIKENRGGWGRHWYHCRIDPDLACWIFEVMP